MSSTLSVVLAVTWLGLCIVFCACVSAFLRRQQNVLDFRRHIRQLVVMRGTEDVLNNLPMHHIRWRIHYFHSVSYRKMFWSFKALRIENFYDDLTFVKSKPREVGTDMFVLMAHIGGVWGFAGVDPHEECAALFIDQMDTMFGEGTAFVAKLPHKDVTDGDGDLEAHGAMNELLKNVQSGNLDLDTAFAEFNNRHEH
jgi:hypothetical protein